MSQTKAQLLGTTFNSDATIKDTLKVSSGTSGDCQLILEADTDNDNETDNPRIYMFQDGRGGGAEIGLGLSTFGNSSGNALDITVTGPNNTGAIHFRTIASGEVSPTTKLTLNHNGKLGLGLQNPDTMLHVYTVTEIPAVLERDSTGSLNALHLRQDDTTDGNGLKITYQSDTTGTGAAENVDFAGIEFVANVHDQATRAGIIKFTTSQGGVGNLIERARINETGTLTLFRNDSNLEGGQLSLTRSVDNAAAWATDVYGDTTTTNYRIIDVPAGQTVVSVGSDSVEIDGGTGVGTAGTFIVRQRGNTQEDGISITSSNSASTRIWKDSNGHLNIGAPASNDFTMRLYSQNNVKLVLNADTDNVDETHDAHILFQQDGTHNMLVVGGNGDTSDAFITNAAANSAFVVSGNGHGGLVPLYLGANYAINMTCNPNGHTLFAGNGTYTPKDRIHVDGSIRIASSLNTNTNQSGRLRFQHYTDAEEPVTGLICNSFSTDNTLYIGGGSSVENCNNFIYFYTTDTNNTTVTGTRRLTIQNDGTIFVGNELKSGNGITDGILQTNAPGGSPYKAQFALGGAHNTFGNTRDEIKLLITGVDNEGIGNYYIYCEDENGNDMFTVRQTGTGQGPSATDSVSVYVDGRLSVGNVTDPASKLVIGNTNAITTAKPTAIISDETNGGSLVIRGLTPKLQFDQTGGNKGTILDDSSGLKIASGNLDTPSPATLVDITSAGVVSIPNQPAFEIYRTTDLQNPSPSTGPLYYKVLTYEYRNFDNSNPDDTSLSTGKFTAPVDGVYFFTISFVVSGGDGSDDSVFCGWLLQNNSTYYNWSQYPYRINPKFDTRNGVEHTYTFNKTVKMASGATMGWYFQDWDADITILDYAAFSGFKVA